MSFFLLVAVRVICAAAFVVCAMREADDSHICLDPPRYKSASCIIVQRERVRVPGRFFTGEWSESRESVVLPCYG